MRGFDYRTPSRTGIALLMCCKLGHSRDVLQGLGRVGRYGDPCARHRLPLLDDMTDSDVVGKHKKALLWSQPRKRAEIEGSPFSLDSGAEEMEEFKE